jgi:hypothetical protein
MTDVAAARAEAAQLAALKAAPPRAP